VLRIFFKIKNAKLFTMVLSFGELLIRFSPDTNRQWLTNNSIDVYSGGSSFVIADALSTWRVPVCFCTALPGNFLSEQIVRNIHLHNIDTSTIIYNGNKIGTYYLMPDDNNNGKIIYDRTHSSFYDLQPGMINWDSVLNGIRWFHFSAISVALNENVAAVCKEALEACTKKSITVSVDLNYLPLLWKYGKEPIDVMSELLQYCDIIMSDIWSEEIMLKIPLPEMDAYTKENCTALSRKVSEEIMKRFPRCKIIANSFSFNDAKAEHYATILSNNNFYVSASYKTNSPVDRSGMNDCFIAGVIYGIYNHLPFQQVINFANAASFQKLFIKGNTTDKTTEEIKSFILHYVH
jgi:2-dehydro-3-deoxygluconokinase